MGSVAVMRAPEPFGVIAGEAMRSDEPAKPSTASHGSAGRLRAHIGLAPPCSNPRPSARAAAEQERRTCPSLGLDFDTRRDGRHDPRHDPPLRRRTGSRRSPRRSTRRTGSRPSCGRKWARSGCTGSPWRRRMAGSGSAIWSMSWRRRRWRGPRPRSGSATAPIRTSASTRSAAGRARSRRRNICRS